jgi:hypothetical protein
VILSAYEAGDFGYTEEERWTLYEVRQQ